MAHPVPTNFGLGDFNTTFFADNAPVLEPLVLAAQALVVFDGSKNFGAKKTVALRLKGTVIDRFRFFDFAKRP